MQPIERLAQQAGMLLEPLARQNPSWHSDALDSVCAGFGGALVTSSAHKTAMKESRKLLRAAGATKPTSTGGASNAKPKKAKPALAACQQLPTPLVNAMLVNAAPPPEDWELVWERNHHGLRAAGLRRLLREFNTLAADLVSEGKAASHGLRLDPAWVLRVCCDVGTSTRTGPGTVSLMWKEYRKSAQGRLHLHLDAPNLATAPAPAPAM